MAARKLNRENEVVPGLALAQGPVPMSCLGGEVVDEAMLLDTYDAHLQILENRPRTTAGTYRSHVKGFLRYLAINYPSVTLSDVTKLQVRAWFLHEANRGIAPVTRSTKLFAVRSFFRFLIAEDMSEENPASLVTLASPVRSRIEFYSDPEADAIVLVRQPKGQPEPPRSLRASGAAQSGGRGRDLGGSGRSALCSPAASHLCHEPRAPGRGHPRRPATDGPLQHRDHKPVLASLGRGPPRRRRPGVPGKLSSATGEPHLRERGGVVRNRTWMSSPQLPSQFSGLGGREEPKPVAYRQGAE